MGQASLRVATTGAVLMCERQDELSALDTRIHTMRAAPDVVQLEVRRMEAEAKKRLDALRAALERNPKEARTVIQAAFDGKLTASPVMTASGRASRSKARRPSAACSPSSTTPVPRTG